MPRLDKLGVTGSSPVPPTSRNPPETAGFLYRGRDFHARRRARVATEWQRSRLPTAYGASLTCRMSVVPGSENLAALNEPKPELAQLFESVARTMGLEHGQ